MNWLKVSGLVLCLCFSASAYAGQGYINTEPAGCPTGDGAEVFDFQDNLLGAVPDGKAVTVNLLKHKPGFYWIQGHDFDGKPISGYVHKDCVTIGLKSSEVELEDTPRISQYSQPKPVDCSKFSDSLPGCKSFNEMLGSNDKDVVSSVGGIYQAYVCFRADEDVFTIISYLPPSNEQFRKATFGVEMQATAYLSRYEAGLSKDEEVFDGKWYKSAHEPAAQAHFTGNGLFASRDQQPKIYVNESEISVSTSWQNLGGTRTTYHLQVRRSTKRFLETFEWPKPPTAKDKSTEQMTRQGYCEEYNP